MSDAQSRRDWREAEKKKSGARLAISGAVALLLVGGGGLWAVSDRGEPAAQVPASCETTLRVPVVADGPMAKALETKPVDASSCVRLDVTEEDSAETARRAAAGQLSQPLWIPDSSARLDRTRENGRLSIHTDSLASSPVLLISRDQIDRPATWTSALGNPDIQMSNPDTASGSLGAIQAVAAEIDSGKVTQDQGVGVLTPRAQTQGVDHPVLDPGPLLDQAASDGGTVIAAEHQLLARDDADSFRTAVPDSGTVMLDYPLVASADSLKDNEAVRAAAADIERWSDSDEGRQALRDQGLRPADGSPIQGGPEVPREKRLTLSDLARWDDIVETYRRQSAPLNALVVVDASGSMGRTDPSGAKRWDTTMNTLMAGSQLFPARDSLGLWVFSQDMGPNGEPYRVVEPVRGMEEIVDGQSQRQRLQQDLGSISYKPGAQTELYDTTRQAYRHMAENYKPGQLNAVFLLSDGGQETYGEKPDRIENVVNDLRQMQDPARPVYIVALGVSKDADDVALGALAGATGGTYHQTTTPEELQQAFVQGLQTVGQESESQDSGARTNG